MFLAPKHGYIFDIRFDGTALSRIVNSRIYDERLMLCRSVSQRLCPDIVLHSNSMERMMEQRFRELIRGYSITTIHTGRD